MFFHLFSISLNSIVSGCAVERFLLNPKCIQSKRSLFSKCVSILAIISRTLLVSDMGVYGFGVHTLRCAESVSTSALTQGDSPLEYDKEYGQYAFLPVVGDEVVEWSLL